MKNLLEQKKMNNKQQQKMFIEAIHHDSKGGQITKMVFFNNEPILNISSKNVSQLVCNGVEGNTYVSLNTFRGKERTTAMLYNVGVMYFDLDGHDLSDSEREIALQNTKDALHTAIENGDLAPFSIWNETGRGLALYLILTNSIAITPKTEKMLRFFDAIYLDMNHKINQILKEYEGITLKVDYSVRDHSRIARVPGTYNFKSRSFCKMIEYWVGNDENLLTYDLGEIVAFNGLTWTGKEKTVEDPIVNDTIAMMNNNELILFEDIVTKNAKNQVKALQNIQKDYMYLDGLHQNMCFIYYNACKRIMTKEEAVTALNEFNDSFQDRGITPSEIKNIIRNVDRHVSLDRKHKGYYILTDIWIKNKLGLTVADCAKYGLCCNTKAQLQHEMIIKDRIDTHKRVVNSILHCSTYNEVVEETKVPLRTVKRIAKTYDCSIKPNKRSVVEVNDIDWYDVEKTMLEKSMSKKCQNIHSNSNCISENEQNEKKSEIIDFLNEVGIHFDIDICDVEEFATRCYKESDKKQYEFQFEVLDYVINFADKPYADYVLLLKDKLQTMSNEILYQTAMKCIGFLGMMYQSQGGTVNILALDLQCLYKGLQKDTISFMLHGKRINENVAMSMQEYPYSFSIKKNCNEIMETIMPILKNCGKEYIETAKMICETIRKIQRGYQQVFFVTRSLEFKVSRTYYLLKIGELDEYDFLKIVHHIVRGNMKQKDINSYMYQIKILWKHAMKHKNNFGNVFSRIKNYCNNVIIS